MNQMSTFRSAREASSKKTNVAPFEKGDLIVINDTQAVISLGITHSFKVFSVPEQSRAEASRKAVDAFCPPDLAHAVEGGLVLLRVAAESVRLHSGLDDI